MKNYILRHLQVFFYTLGQLAKAPVASVMTIGVIAIVLALPSGVLLVIDNLESLTEQWGKGDQVSLFLKKKVSEEKIQRFIERLKKRPEVKSLQYLSPKDALEEFKRLSDFGAAVEALSSNPLPGVIIIKPKPSSDQESRLRKLVAELENADLVDQVQWDVRWIQRLDSLLHLAKRAVWALTAILSLGVLLTIANTIRLAVLNRREEIQVIKLVGGTSAFIRRPFLYLGAVQGFLGAFLAWLVLLTTLWWLSGPVNNMAQLYGSQFSLDLPDMAFVLALLLLGTLLGWLGALVAVGRILIEFEPS